MADDTSVPHLIVGPLSLRVDYVLEAIDGQLMGMAECLRDEVSAMVTVDPVTNPAEYMGLIAKARHTADVMLTAVLLTEELSTMLAEAGVHTKVQSAKSGATITDKEAV